MNTPEASDEPMLKQFASYLKAKDETISVLQEQVKSEQNKRATQEAIRNYEDIGRSSFLFHPHDLADLFTPLSSLTFVTKTINDTITISTWLPPNRKTCPVVSLWSPTSRRL